MSTATNEKRTRTAKPAEQRRRDILDAAVETFVRDGVADAKVEDITKLAEVSKGTFYLYFKSKDEAAAEAWKRHMERFALVGETMLASDEEPLGDRLIHVLEALTRFALENADVHRTLYDVAGGQAVKAAANERLIKVISDAAEAGIASGELHCSEPTLTARALYHGFCGAATDAVTGFVAIDNATLIKAAGDMTRSVFQIG